MTEGIPSEWPFLVNGPATIYESTTASSFGELLRPHRTVRQEQGQEGTELPMSADGVVGPAVLIHEVGQGVVLTLACAPDYATASEYAIVEARRLLVNAARWLHPKPRIRITAPANVQTVVTDDPTARCLRVHFLGYNAPPQTTPAKSRPAVIPALIEDPPIFRAVLECRDDIRDVGALHPMTRLERDGRKVRVQINEIHDVVLIRY
jgi:hypothetical protein